MIPTILVSPRPLYPCPPCAVAAPVDNIQYNGLTIKLTAQAFISANVTNHIKIAVADYNDNILDSAVFIKAQTSCP
jgi:hypothetical protein